MSIKNCWNIWKMIAIGHHDLKGDKNMKKMTIEEYNKKLQEKYPKDNLSCLEYSLMTKPCVIQCNNCGKIYSFTQGQFALKRKDIFCKKCKYAKSTGYPP